MTTAEPTSMRAALAEFADAVELARIASPWLWLARWIEIEGAVDEAIPPASGADSTAII